ncbi:MAG: heme-binding protein [Alishewanella sp.]|nr:heme-binding protein [Alishewanella sp.]
MTLLRTTLLLLLSLFAVKALAIEEAKYAVEVSERDFELRLYEPHIVAETAVAAEFDEAGNAAFQRLFKYISGNNAARQDIAMTTPVGQAAEGQKIDMTTPVGQQQQAGRWLVSFMMPAEFTLETIPEPRDPLVKIRQVPAQRMAAITYSGFWSEKGYLRHKEKLMQWINDKGYQVAGEPSWARYNPPLMPWFMRRNEVLVPVIVAP